MKTKLVVIIGVTIAVFFSLAIWRVGSFLSLDRLASFQSQSRSEISAFNQWMTGELGALNQKIYLIQATEGKKWEGVSPYYAVATLKLNQNRLAQVNQLFVNEKSVAKDWKKENLVSSLQGILFENNYHALNFKDTEGKTHFAIILKYLDQAWFFVGPLTILQSFINGQKGSLGEWTVVDKKGMILANEKNDYLGALTSYDWVVSQIEQQQTQGVLVGNSSQSTILFDQTPSSNMYVIKAAKTSDIQNGQGPLYGQLILLAIGVLFITVAFLLWQSGDWESGEAKLHAEIEKWKSQLLDLEKTKSQLIVPVKVAEKKHLANNLDNAGNENFSLEEKMRIYTRLASGMAHELKGPVMGVLAEAHLALAKSSPGENRDVFNKIVHHSRQARDIIDKLFSFAGEKMAEKNSMKLEGPLLLALKKHEALFVEKNIQVIKKISETKPFLMAQADLIKAIDAVLLNAVEAMERMPNKKLTVELFQDGEFTHLKVSDTGEGITIEQLPKIFDPFYTSRGFMNHMGMGLPVTMAICQSHQGSIVVHSERGAGTTMEMKFQNQQTQNIQMSRELDVPVKELPLSLPQAPINSEMEFLELEKTSEPLVEKKESPLDLDLDQLLAMPEDRSHQENSNLTPPATESKIAVPQFKMSSMESHLDKFKVDIRKPGSR